MADKTPKKDVVVELVEVLHRLQLRDIASMDDTTLKGVAALLMNWHVLVSEEEDKRAMSKR